MDDQRIREKLLVRYHDGKEVQGKFYFSNWSKLQSLWASKTGRRKKDGCLPEIPWNLHGPCIRLSCINLEDGKNLQEDLEPFAEGLHICLEKMKEKI
jgi:hypothetical protein